jgi:hypothetical protein
MPTVTLTNANQNYRISDLLQAVDPAISGGYQEITFENDNDNTASTDMRFLKTATQANLSDTNFDFRLGNGEDKVFRSDVNSLMVGDWYVRSDLANARLNVTLVAL